MEQTHKIKEGNDIYAIRMSSLKNGLPSAFFWLFDEEQKKIEPEIKNGVATIKLHKPLGQEKSWSLDGYTDIQKDIEALIKNKEVKEIILDMDSPGGSVLGVAALAEYIYKARSTKPIIAYVNSMAASAAYWLAAACSKIVLASETTVVGSIGVVYVHVDSSQMHEKMGYKITEIVAGKYKRVASENAPLTEEGRKSLQETIDYFYNVFLISVAKYRGKTVENILEVAEGKDFIGTQAIQNGLADEIKNQIIVMKGKEMTPEEMQKKIDELQLEIEQLKKENEDLKNKQQEPEQAEDEKKDEEMVSEEEEEKKDDTVASAIKRERERMLAIDDLNVGEETAAILSKAKADGWSAGKTAIEICKAMKSKGVSTNKKKFALQNESVVLSSAQIPTAKEKEDASVKETASSIANIANSFRK